LKFTIDGTDYEALMPDDMTLGVQRAFQKIAGKGINHIADLGEDWDADVMVAWMAVSIHAVKQDTPISQIEDRLDRMLPSEVKDAWADVEAELAGQSPPLTTPGLDGSETISTGSSEADSEQAPVNKTLNGSGGQTSLTGATYDPETSNT